MRRHGACPEPCDMWQRPDGCCSACDNDEAEAIWEQWWPAVVEWVRAETCHRFPGVCPAEVLPCPPCLCAPTNCRCGPWAQIDLTGAFCQPIHVAGGVPQLEFVFPQPDGTDRVIGPDEGGWALRPDLVTVDWCEPVDGPGCGQLWPRNDLCDRPWSIRALVGVEPPSILVLGAARFTCEIVKDCQGKDSCLPDGVRSITRRGITMDVGPQFEETIRFDTQGTGVPQLDFALRRWGCDTVPARAMIDPLADAGNDDLYRRPSTGKANWLYADPYRDWRNREKWGYVGVLNPTPPALAAL